MHRRSPRIISILALLLIPGLAPGQESSAWTPLVADTATAATGARLTALDDGSLLATVVAAPAETYVIEARTRVRGITAIRLECLDDPSLPGHGPGHGSGGNFVLSEVALDAAPEASKELRSIPIDAVIASHAQSQWAEAGTIDGDPATGWAIKPWFGQPAVAIFELGRKVDYGPVTRLRVTLRFEYGSRHTLGRFRVSVSATERPLPLDWGDAWWLEKPSGIRAAIRTGLAWLLSQQEVDGSWSGFQSEYPSGATALAVYTLLRCGVEPEHQAIRRALAWIKSHPPAKTYSAGTTLLALEALRDPNERQLAEDVTANLLAWRNGVWAYPAGSQDLSNTQYGALGLRAAASLGIAIPAKVWENLAEESLEFRVGGKRAYGPTGFGYRRGGAATNSMTAAGIAILAIVEEALGSTRARDIKARAAKEAAITWLADSFVVDRNVGTDNDRWLYYYLYGVERVGGLTGIRWLGRHDWYRDGAAYLVGKQEKRGSWTTAYGERQPNTCFALLFLARATSTTSTDPVDRVAKSYGTADPTHDVNLRASGDTPLTLWLAPFGDAVRERLAWPGEADRGLRVVAVDYLAQRGSALPADVTWRGRADPPAGFERRAYDATTWTRVRGAATGIPLPPADDETREAARLALRAAFRVDDPESLPQVGLVVARRDDEEGASASAVGADVVCLLDENDALVGALDRRTGASVVESIATETPHGARALRVTPSQRHSPTVPGWFFRIARDPVAGEYRYLRFAWRKDGGTGIMIQIARDGVWGAESLRYFAGRNTVGHVPAIAVSRRIPSDWTVVTCDLWKDFGGPANVTGIALTPMDGTAGWFDGIYLARRKSDLRSLPSDVATPTKSGAFAGAADRVQVWLNESLVYDGPGASDGGGQVATTTPLAPLLRKGENLLAVVMERSSPRSRVALDLPSWDVIASVAGDPGAPAGAARFAARYAFPHPGDFRVGARVRIAAADGDDPTLFAEPFEVRISAALDPEVLSYADDDRRNLLRDGRARASASSSLKGHGADAAVDNRIATAWLCADGDPAPALTLALSRVTRAEAIVLTIARADLNDPARTARPASVRVVINGAQPGRVVALEPNDSRKVVVALDSAIAIRRLELTVLDRRDVGDDAKNAVGFAEVELRQGMPR